MMPAAISMKSTLFVIDMSMSPRPGTWTGCRGMILRIMNCSMGWIAAMRLVVPYSSSSSSGTDGAGPDLALAASLMRLAESTVL